MATPEEGHCESRDDKTHCNCWWDGARCCSCGHGASSHDPLECDACKRVIRENEHNPESTREWWEAGHHVCGRPDEESQ